MSKFGDIINVSVPVLINFYTDWSDSSSQMVAVVQNVSDTLGDTAYIVRIDAEKNKELAAALKIIGLPTFLVYKKGQMVWRESGILPADTLIQALTNED
nr:thioredoxin family protein [uncultured Flavobacterium sp.]